MQKLKKKRKKEILNQNNSLKGQIETSFLYQYQNKISITKRWPFLSFILPLSRFSHKTKTQHDHTYINIFMTSEFCSTCNELESTPYSCSTCHKFMCIPCVIAYVLSASYPAKIIRNCPFCNTSLTTHVIKRLYLANLEYAGSGTNVTHQPHTIRYERRNGNPYI